jgi:hypothetical protein
MMNSGSWPRILQLYKGFDMDNILRQDSEMYTTHFGWYGVCGKECTTFDLKSAIDIIHAVYQFESGGSGVKTFLSGSPDMFQSFLKLDCGRGYWIVLKPGTGQLELEHFTISSYESDAVGSVVNQQNCNM